MLHAVIRPYDRVTFWLRSKWPEAIMLLFVRVTLAGIFWRSGRTKVEEGSWLTVSENTLYQFTDDPFNKLPLLPHEFAAYLTTYLEHALPILLVAGLFTRLSACALLGMTVTIQLWIFPDAWWPVHSLWAALTLVLIMRGGGTVSIDALLIKRRK
jgi:putative oxidoreductase